MKIEVGDYFQFKWGGDVLKVISKPNKKGKKFKIMMLSDKNIIEASHYWLEEGVAGKHIKKLSHLQGKLYEGN